MSTGKPARRHQQEQQDEQEDGCGGRSGKNGAVTIWDQTASCGVRLGEAWDLQKETGVFLFVCFFPLSKATHSRRAWGQSGGDPSHIFKCVAHGGQKVGARGEWEAITG